MLHVAVVRHGIAEDRDIALRGGRGDGERALTATGRRKMEDAAAGLRRILPEPGLVACSPLRRARETAVILTRVYGGPDPVETTHLAPGLDPATLLEWLRRRVASDAPAVCVGHEPDLGCWVGWCLGLPDAAPVVFKKGAVCLLEIGASGAQVRWFLTPRQLRLLGSLP